MYMHMHMHLRTRSSSPYSRPGIGTGYTYNVLLGACERYVTGRRELAALYADRAKYMDPCTLTRTQLPQRPWPSTQNQPSLTPDLPDETIVSRRLKTRLIW